MGRRILRIPRAAWAAYGHLSLADQLRIVVGAPTVTALVAGLLAFLTKSDDRVVGIIGLVWAVVIVAILISVIVPRWIKPRSLRVTAEFRSALMQVGDVHQGYYLGIVLWVRNDEGRDIDLEPSVLVAPRAPSAKAVRVSAMYSPPPGPAPGDPHDTPPFLRRGATIGSDGSVHGVWQFRLDPLVMAETGMAQNRLTFMREDVVRLRDSRTGRFAEFAFGSNYPIGTTVQFEKLSGYLMTEGDSPNASSGSVSPQSTPDTSGGQR